MVGRASSRSSGLLGETAVRINSQDRQPVWCRLPVIVHRPLPVDADVTDVRLTRRRIAAGHRLSVDVSVRLPDPEPVSPAGVVAGVDTGWRMMDDGSLRVAVWTTAGDADPMPHFPHHIADAIHAHPDGGGEVRIPASWLAEWNRLARIQQRRDKTFDQARRLVLDWLDTHPDLADTLDLDPQQVAMWRSPQRLAGVVRTAADQLAGDHPLARQLEGWRHTDRRLWERHAHTSDQLTARRTDLYRNLAAYLVELVDAVAVKTGFVPEATRIPPAGQDDTHQAARARRHAQLGAPASLTTAIQEAATNRGTRAVDIDARDTSAVHHGCGGQLDDNARRHHHRVRCPNCGDLVDQDHNTARLLAEAALRSQSDDERTPPGKRW